MVLSLLWVAMSGCGGGDNLYLTDVSSIAERSLPSIQNTRAHPDSLRRLSVVEEENRIRLELDESYQRMHQKWSSSFRFPSARREISRPLTYATLWSKELSLASLEPDEGLSSLSIDQARSRLQTAREEYRETLQIDVYWFSGPDGTPITGPSAHVRLRDGQGNSYRPVRSNHGPLRNASILGRSSVLYRRNIFYFDRVVDGQDILDGVEELRLRVSPTTAPDVEFGWRWPLE